jgi:2-methylisocitrate lyase-like PEP mutase family enzyme
MDRQANKARAFQDLHRAEPFVIPNPWDAGSARVLEGLGFKALATTSSGFAFTLGRLDGNVTLDEVARHVARLDAATDLPLSADLENGFGPAPESASRAITRVAESGAVGASIEDYDPEGRLYDINHATERIAAAAEAATRLSFPFMLTARAENHIRGNPDLDDTIARLKAYEDAGADVVYAPGLANTADIATVCEAVSKPVNVLALGSASLAQLTRAGAQRISVGGALTWVAVEALTDVARKIRDSGDLSGLDAHAPPAAWLEASQSR